MVTSSVSAVVSVLRGQKLLEPAQLEELMRTVQPRCPTSQALAKELLQRGWLTAYQANQLLQGKAEALVLGPYVLLERLGEGAMGEIFKARHVSMNRLAALKILRKDLLADSDAVGRFYREVEVLSHMSHPNIVRAYDADVIGQVHYLAMEYVEGIDLDQKVRERGALSIPEACDYMRQAANGLQHAHEKGLVHRDIKPSNLLVSQNKAQMKPTSSTELDMAYGGSEYGLLKILDLGLARLQQPAEGSRTRNLTLLAGNQVMQGTPEYMAPEQALDFHTADIRADLYSLGCTLYFLLAGKPPFEGTLHEKLLKHQTAEPPHITSVRGDVPAGLLPIMRKMLAKRPADRYQTPGELARSLTAFLLSGGGGSSTPPPNKNLERGSVVRKRGSTLRIQKEKEAAAIGLGASRKPVVQIKRTTRVSTPEEKQRRRKIAFIGGGAVAAILGGFMILVLIAGSGSAPGEPSSGSHASQPVIPPPIPLTRSNVAAIETPRLLQPTLIIQCGKDNGKQQDQTKMPGYDYKLVQGSIFEGWPDNPVKSHCWQHDKELIFEISIPKGTGGLLHLWLVDGDKKGRKETLFVQGKQIGGVRENFGVAEQIDVPVPASDAEQGKIEVKLVNQGPASAVVSAIEFMPYARR